MINHLKLNQLYFKDTQFANLMTLSSIKKRWRKSDIKFSITLL